MQASLKVLLLGHSPEGADAVVSELERSGFELTWHLVDDEPRLRAALRSRWDMIIADLAAAEVDSLWAFDLLRRADPVVPFVLLVGDQDLAQVLTAVRQGVGVCLRRADLSLLGETVRAQLERAGRERKRIAANSALNFQHHRYRNLFENAPVALLEVDLSSAIRFVEAFADNALVDVSDAEDHLMKSALERVRILAANDAAVQLLGAGSADRLRASHGSLKAARGDLWLDILGGLRSGEGGFEEEVTLINPDGREVDVLVAVRQPGEATELRSVVISLTNLGPGERLENGEQIMRRLESVGRLASKVTHDLNNQLTVIKGYLGLLLDTLPDGDPVQRDLTTVDAAASAAQVLMEQLAAFTRPRRWEPKILNLNAVVSRALHALRDIVGDDVDLVTTLADGLWEVEADADCVEKLLVNLAANAREAMPDGGTLKVETSNTYVSAEQRVSSPGPARGDYAMVSVTDSGRGMDAQTLERCIEPLFTTKGPPHAGLGLSDVHGIVRQAGGMIRPLSEPGHGATFQVLLPRASAP